MPAPVYYLEMSDALTGAHKFYEVKREGVQVTIRYGRIGATGRTETQTFPDEAAAQSFVDIKLREKKAKGYIPAQPGVRPPQPPSPPPTPGSEPWLWALVEKSKRGAGGDCEAQCTALQKKLTTLPVVDIVAFGRLMEQLRQQSYRADLWGAAFLINGGCSDDGFDYFRGWLVLQGEKVYRAALEDPDSLAQVVPESDDVECEEALYVAVQAYETKTGRDDFYSFIPERNLNLIGDLDDWDDGEGDMDEQKAAQLYPRLWRKFMASG